MRENTVYYVGASSTYLPISVRDNALLSDEVEGLKEHLRRIEDIANSPHPSDAIGWVKVECWKARTVECGQCKGHGLVGVNHHVTCNRCGGTGRHPF
jgi:hypothetical protein